MLIKKHYEKITMYCNKESYDKIIQYIPYDEIIIIENNKNNIAEYKFDIIKKHYEDIGN
mgnify:CR=1 FL=1